MPDPNPYASPSTVADADARSDGTVGAWRQGDYLVLHRNLHGKMPRTALPQVCVFTGQPSDGGSLQLEFQGPGDKYRWRVVLGGNGNATAILPVNREIRTAYDGKGMLLLAGLGCGFGLGLAGAILWWNGATLLALLCGLGAVAAFVVATYAIVTRPSLALYDIDARYVWLRGASPEFLKLLPEWPFEPA